MPSVLPASGRGRSLKRSRRKKRAASSSVFLFGGRRDASNAFVLRQRHLSQELLKRPAVLNVIKASLVGSALMLLEGCANLQSYQTPCVQGHVCECVQYTTVNRSWVDCRSYGRVSLPRPLTR